MAKSQEMIDSARPALARRVLPGVRRLAAAGMATAASSRALSIRFPQAAAGSKVQQCITALCENFSRPVLVDGLALDFQFKFVIGAIEQRNA